MAVALVHRRIGGEEVQVAPPLHVIHPRTAGALDHYIQRMVVVRPILFFERDELCCCPHILMHLRKVNVLRKRVIMP